MPRAREGGERLRGAGRELVRRPARSASVLLGQALAAGMVLFMVALLTSIREESARILSSTGTHFVAYAPFAAALALGASASALGCEDCTPRPGSSEGFVAEGVYTVLLPVSVLEQARELPSVLDASPYLRYRLSDAGLTVIGGLDTRASEAVRSTTCAPSDIVEGRFLEAGERGAIMVEAAAARQRGIHPGDSVRLGAADFGVVGVVNTGVRPGKADVYMSIEDATAIIELRIANPLALRFNMLLVEARDSRVHARAMHEVRALGGENVLLSSYNCYRPASAVLGMGERGIWIALAAVCIVALGFGLKSRHAAVLERTRELGILRAVGWPDRDILGQLALESAVLSGCGFLVGCGVASGVLLLLDLGGVAGAAGALRIRLDWLPYAAALLVTLGGGLVAGILPALWTLRRSAAEMLRTF